MGSSRTCLVFFTLHLIYIYMTSAQETVKRVPQGFVGMRGKKVIDASEIDNFYKRKPQFFVGVKGKKSLLDDSGDEQFNYKRSPMGFVGMRGKKDNIPIDDVLNYLDNYDTPKTAGSFIGQIDYSANTDLMQSDDKDIPILNDLFAHYLKKMELDHLSPTNFDRSTMEDQSNDQMNYELYKRAAKTHQFFGVRGKKSLQNKRPYDLTFRGKFIGVRGKKDLKDIVDQDIIKFLPNQAGPWPKRKTQMGFFGMRGKKWNDESSPETVLTK